MDWIIKELKHITSTNPYKRPERLRDYNKLDSNENMVLEKKFIKAISFKSANNNDFREYPLEQFEILFKELSKYLHLDIKNIGIGSGSDQIMDLLLSTIGRGKKVTTINPTFSYFIDRCNLYNIAVKSINLSPKDNNVDFDHLIRESINSDIIYLASPNNPTGNQFKMNDLKNLVETLKNKLIIIDEAYVEFADYSFSNTVTKYNNVIIMRTFSKALGLAGARIGYLLSNENLIKIFNEYIQLPYPVSSFSMQMAIEVLQNIHIIKRSINIIKKERERIFNELKEIGAIKIYPSDANFFFFQTFEHHNRIREELFNNKILIKSFGDIGNYKGAIRSTIGPSEINDKIISILLQKKNNNSIK